MQSKSSSRSSLLAIDPGNTSGVVVVTIAAAPKLLFWTQIKIKKKGEELPSSLIARLKEEHDIVAAAIEDQFYLRNINSLKVLSKTAGRWEEACLAAGLESVEWINPKTWQTALFGKTMRRDQFKAASCAMAKAETRQLLPVDVADAYCIGRFLAIRTWLFSSPGTRRGAAL
jgi:Holliday junction resolvasome RuvABC endonuclease subunit